MAKRRNKAAKIRQVLSDNPSASAKEVVELLAAQRTRVSAAQVYNVKSMMGTTGTKGKSSKSSKYDQLIQAKKLADAMGGIDKARAALDVLSRLM